MRNILCIIKLGLKPSGDKIKIFLIAACSTLFLTKGFEYTASKKDEQLLISLMAIIVIENFLTCGVYGSLKKALSAQTFTHHIFFSSAIRFFIRFLLIKMFFIFFLIFFAGLLFMVAEVTAKLPLHLTAVIVLLWLMWLTVPAFYFVLSLFAPIVLFSQDTEIFQSIKLGIISARKFLDKLVVIAFFYFLSIGLLVFFPEKAYNSISNTWMIYKSIVASFLEVGFISSLLLFYEKECNDERSI